MLNKYLQILGYILSVLKLNPRERNQHEGKLHSVFSVIKIELSDSTVVC